MSKEATKIIDLHYLVILKKRTAKAPDKFFVITQIRRDEFTNPAVFHGVGFWSERRLSNSDIVSDKQITEVWIPWGEIDHVESLMYRQRS